MAVLDHSSRKYSEMPQSNSIVVNIHTGLASTLSAVGTFKTVHGFACFRGSMYGRECKTRLGARFTGAYDNLFTRTRERA